MSNFRWFVWALVAGSLLLISLSGNNPSLVTSVTPGAEQGDLGTLAIPPRLQWINDHGYCGETALQSIGLYYGAWISQKVARQVAGGELLLGVNAETAVTKLHFDFETWPAEKRKASFADFMVWLKAHLLKGYPSMIGVYLHGQEHQDPDYDHIIPVVGVRSSRADPRTFDEEDALIFYNNFAARRLERRFASLCASRSSCTSSLDEGGCIPSGRYFGLVIKGIADQDQATVPVKISVERWDEPNVSLGEEPAPMKATVAISGLQNGRSYALLRYHDYRNVPTRGNAITFLKSPYDRKLEFTATSAMFRYKDSQPFLSDGSLYYRCVQLP